MLSDPERSPKSIRAVNVVLVEGFDHLDSVQLSEGEENILSPT